MYKRVFYAKKRYFTTFLMRMWKEMCTFVRFFHFYGLTTCTTPIEKYRNS